MKNRSEKIANSLVYLIRIFRIMRDKACEYGVKPPLLEPNYWILTFLTREELSISEIGRRLQRSKPNMTAIINKLISEGRVERREDPKDRRIVEVALTAEGQKYIEECWQKGRESVRARLSTLSDEEKVTLYKALEDIRIILSNLDEMRK